MPFPQRFFFWLRQCKAKFSTRCNCFSGVLWRIEILSSCDGVTLRHGDCALIGEVQFLLQDYLTDSWIASRYRSQAGLSKISEENTDRVRRAYFLWSSPGKSGSSWVAGGLRKVHIELFCWGYHIRWFLDVFLGEVESKCSKIILEWAIFFDFNMVRDWRHVITGTSI